MVDPLVGTLALLLVALLGARVSFSSERVPPGPRLLFRTGTHFLLIVISKLDSSLDQFALFPGVGFKSFIIDALHQSRAILLEGIAIIRFKFFLW